ncbi:MAG TPA: hypothetical protein VEK15_22315 [Vicinamibacteria bacterium]|nr:hypothetical protein [Vicinamibacteria bacterium]
MRINQPAESAVWEPGGRRVTFLSFTRRVLYRIASDGSENEPELLIPDVILDSLWTYTPDGREILGERIAGDARRLLSYPIDGGDPRTILQTDGIEIEAALSPDGRFIAYTSDATGRPEIWLRPFDEEGPPIRVSSQGGQEPGWSADGGELYFRRRGPASTTPDLFAVSVVAEPALRVDMPRLLFSFPFLTPYTPTYDVGRDGRFLMVGGTPGEGTGNLVLVLDWFSELERLAPTP